jgi:hypothetical protein
LARQVVGESAGLCSPVSVARADGWKYEFIQAPWSELRFDNGSVAYIRFFRLENVSFGKSERSFHRENKRNS